MIKSKYIVIAAVMSTAILVDACSKSFLERSPQGALQGSDLQNKDGIEALLVGSYAALDGQNSGTTALNGGNPWEAAPSNWIYGSVAAGDAHKGSDATDQPPVSQIAVGNFDPSNGFFNTKWQVLFEGVSRINTLLSLLPAATGMTDAEKTGVKAQALFLRGHFYFELKKMYDKVPWVDETKIDDYKQPNNVDIWPKIEADFQFAYDNLPETQSNVGRANKWAAACYLAKTYVFEAKWTAAKPLFDLITTKGKTSNGLSYGLTDRFEDNFDPAAKNNKESVFAIQMAANDGTGSIANGNQGEMLNFPYNSPFGCCGFYQPTQELVNSYRTDDGGLPYLDDYNDHAVKNDMKILSTEPFTPDAGNLDPRLDWTVGRRGIPYLDWGNHPGRSWVRDQDYAGPYAPKKNVYWQYNQDKYKDANSWAPGSAINIVLIRYSDVLLQAAETEANLGNYGTAETYVNLVRTRAGKPATAVYKYTNDATPMGGFSTTPAAKYVVATYPAGTFAAGGKNYSLKAIYFERKLELAMEGQRYFDLVRWGIAGTELTKFFTYESKITTDITGGKFVTGRNEHYPIPQRQIDLSVSGSAKTLEQNKGY
ncbi:RagB/SusD family nutrient uptake outer membrane protein [Chitinophaga sancti]|uniref:RagB/SusD family nutrient uptake outer membrane protein n=1 Tax=Chitinophaga sancti TaxID=1004 RepID=A0A1K1PIZ1_9BACT|nr:RagB/SusD family nutrient uptake outer membrane protein [Chitinophaga sancti]WQD59462.1 RagB/SusD family nutrient uptake outer membrane protein [Chitinophaga sancti]WQG88404.1 RagB/SusD family nutrient uptake outer membrane protein [Chitinophaga sancti]SFW47770.1 Starch-binding associating with outer membrane [Chitinophaga sancti]